MDSVERSIHEAANFMKLKRENALKRYLDEFNIKDVFAYDYNYSSNTFIIYTSKPGIWIGLHGKGANRLKQILSEDITENCNVEFREIKGNFIVHS